MINKYFVQAWFAVLVLLGVSTSMNATIYEVGTASEFIKHWTANDSIQLTADIDLSSFTDDDIVDNYTAELSGVKDTSYVYTGNETDEELDEHMFCYVIKNAPEMLATEMHGAYIHHVMFMDCKPDWSTLNTVQGTAVLARYSYNCKFACIFLYKNVVNGETKVKYSNDASCFVCQDDGSSFRYVHAYACKTYCMDSYAGILVGEAKNSRFFDCSANYGCAVYADGTLDNSYSGGLVGEATNVTFEKCVNNAYVAGGKDCVGGVAGKGTNTKFRNCDNGGSVTIAKYSRFSEFSNTSDAVYTALPASVNCDEIQKSHTLSQFKKLSDESGAAVVSALGVGTFRASQMIRWHNFNNIDSWQLTCFENSGELFSFDEIAQNMIKVKPAYSAQAYIGMSFAIIMAAYQLGTFIYEAQDDDNVGGIVGLMDGGSASQCANYGIVYSADAYAGGIVGEARNSSPVIQNCLNQGLVKGYEQTGGIVGRIESGTLKNCLNLGNVNNGNSSEETFGKIYGQKSDGVTSSNNLYAGTKDATGTADCREVSLKSLASGKTALFLNQKADSVIWHQTIGLDYYPTLIISGDTVTTAKIQSSIDPTVRTKNASTFLKALLNQYSNVELTDDIELNTSMFNLSSKYMPFYGSIDGQNHCLSNVRYVLPYTTEKIENNDNSPRNVGLLSWAVGASFKDLELKDFKIDYSLGWGEYCGLLVGHSSHCTYDNIRITGASSISASSGNYTMYHAGGLIGYSVCDTITNCSTGSRCQIHGDCSWNTESVYIGGLIGNAVHSKITNCYNQASVSANNDYVAGIVSYADSCEIRDCLNMGSITGEEEVGGIAGYSVDTDIAHCVNTGAIRCNATIQDGEVGGIVGVFDIDKNHERCLHYCYNWGSIDDVYENDHHNAIYGETNNADLVINNTWSFYCEGNYYKNIDMDKSAILSGQLAYNNNQNRVSVNLMGRLYQDIDNNTFPTHYPVPIASAGVVYENYLCDGTLAFSNKHDNTTSGTHTPVLDKFGLCTVCGAIHDAPATVAISDADDMTQFACATNKGQDFSNSVVSLENDIDMKDVDNYIPVGVDINHPFRGTFNGNNYSIKNLNIDRAAVSTGIFGFVSSLKDGQTEIKQVVVDSTCTVVSTGNGVAALVGCISSISGVTDNVNVLVTRCANLASVTGNKNVAGLVGGIYNNNNIHLYMADCYNTGTITGSSESAALVGYARRNFNISACWNSGKVTGYDEGHSMIRYQYDGANAKFSKVFQLSSLPKDNKVRAMSDTLFANGIVCDSLIVADANVYEDNVWGQKIEAESMPHFSSQGISYERKMSNRWGTLILPYPAYTNDDVQLYEITSCNANEAEGSLNLTAIDKVEANTPCFFKKKNADATSVEIPMKSTDTFSMPAVGSREAEVENEVNNEWTIIGVLYDYPVSVLGCFYLAQDKLWYARQRISLNAYRAVLGYRYEVNLCKSMNICVIDGDDVTKIGEIDLSSPESIDLEGAVYNLSGQRLSHLQKGQVNIINGKKVFVK